MSAVWNGRQFEIQPSIQIGRWGTGSIAFRYCPCLACQPVRKCWHCESPIARKYDTHCLRCGCPASYPLNPLRDIPAPPLSPIMHSPISPQYIESASVSVPADMSML